MINYSNDDLFSTCKAQLFTDVGDDVVLYKYGEKSAQSLSSAGFRYITFKSYDG